MTSMDLAAEKLKLIDWLTGQNQEVIEELIEWTKDHGTVSIEQYNQDLDRAKAAIARGEYTSHSEAVKRISSWRDQ